MGRFFRNYEVSIFLCALTLPGFAGIPSAQPEPSLKINVGVYNYERVPDAILTRAKQEATRVFARVGVETVWVDCATSPAERPKYPACQRLLQSGPLFLSLKILSRSMAEALHPRFPSTSYFGFAMLDTHGGFGSYASIFFHRVKQRAQKPLLPIHTVLGHVMAHEVGHLLLGFNGHSALGIMRAKWSKKDLERATRGNLRFTRRQAARMQAQIDARNRSTGPSRSP